MKTLKLAVIGTGHLGRIHARLARQLEGVELVGVADTCEAARNDVAEELETEAFADFRELVGKIDAAIVATPTRTHFQVGTKLLSHGIHTLIEKPLAADVAEADALVDTARRHGAILQVGHVERFNPALGRILPHVEDPKYIDAVRVSGYPFRSTDIGVVHDLMIHDLDVVLFLVQSPLKTIEALGVSVLGQHEDTANARLTFENGCVATLTASRVSYRPQRTMQIWSSESFASIDFGTRSTTIVRPSEQITSRRFDLDALTPEEQHHLKQHLFNELLIKETIEGAEGNALADEQRDLVECIRAGREPRVTGNQARQCLLVAEQILHKIDDHHWDGKPEGRIGPLATPAAPILRGPHWHLAPQPADGQQREAG